MRVYYQDSEVCITPSGFRVDGRVYPLRHIEHVWRSRRRALGRKVKGAGLVLTIVLAIQAVLILIGRWVLALSGGGMVLVGAGVLFVRWMIHLAAGAPALNAVEDLRRYGSRHELWAIVAGDEVLLLSTDDAIRHGQVCRALARALTDLQNARRAAPHRPAPNQAAPNQAVPNQAARRQALPNRTAPNQAAPNQAAPNRSTGHGRDRTA